MISRLLLRGQNRRERQASCLLLVIAMIIIAVTVIKITDFKIEPPAVPLLPPSSSLVMYSDPAQAQAQTSTIIISPKELFGANLHTVGIYHQATGNLPAESVIQIYQKDNWRFVEITQRPGRTLNQELLDFPGYPQTPIQLGPLAGVLIATDPGYEHCIDPQEDGTPGFCLLSYKINFEMDGQLITVAGNRQKITQGQLISIARSLIPPIEQPIIQIEPDTATIDIAASE